MSAFPRYCLVGGVNTVLDFSIYTSLTRGFVFWRSHFLLANALSFTIVVTWSFFWNKYWTFGNRTGAYGMQYVRFVVTTFVGLGIAEAFLAFGVVVLGFPDLAAKVLAAPCVVAWNFLVYRTWAFAERKSIPAVNVALRTPGQ